MSGIFAAIGRGVVRLRWLVLVVWIVATVLAVHAFPSLASQVNNNNSAFLPSSAPSNQAAVLAEPLIGSTRQAQVPVVAVTTGASLNAADQDALKRAATQLEKVPTVKHVTFLGVSPDRKAAQLLVVSSVNPFDQTHTQKLVDDIDATLAKVGFPSGMSAYPAGQVATNVANNKQSKQQGNEIQLFSIIFILALLFVIFRAALAPIITLMGPLFALALSGSFIGALGSQGLKISFFTQILLIVLLLGAGTDYGLFLVFRVREELLDGKDPKDAVARAMARVGESITASGATVIVALLTLTLASFGIYHDLGVPLAIGVGVMLLAGLTLLPALLAIFGRVVFWPSKTAPRDHRDGTWGRVAGRMVQRPALSLSVGVIVLGALALCAFGYRSGGFGGNLAAPPGTTAAKGNTAVATHFPGSSSNPTNLVMAFGTPLWDDPQPLTKATNALEKSGAFRSLAGPLDPNGTKLTPTQLAELHRELGASPQELAATAPVPPADSTVPASLYDAYVAAARFVSADGKTVQWEASLTAGGPQSTGAIHAVPDIRTTVADAARQAGATDSGVAGEAAALYDVSSISGNDLRHIIPVAVLAIGLVLLLVLRSLVAPIYLILSVVLSYLASLGLSVLVFMDIAGLNGIVFLLPFLMFVFLLALGEDYNILVMTRIREEAHHTKLRDAVVRAVGVTGPTVTSAGLVLAGSFGVLAVVGGSGTGATQIREIGVGLAMGILLDTFVVRTVLVPSTVALLGRWNWWPSSLSRGHATASGSGPTADGGGGGGGRGPLPSSDGDGRGTSRELPVTPRPVAPLSATGVPVGPSPNPSRAAGGSAGSGA